MGAVGKLEVGDEAPDFCLRTSSGEEVRLSRFRGHKEVVVYFYPRDGTPGCTVEACAFRDEYERFRDAGAEVIGISGDTAESHARFSGRHRLPFILLSDPGGAVASRFGVGKTLGILPGRATFLVDRQGIVRHVYRSQLLPAQHITQMLRVLAEIQSKPAAG